MSEKLNVSSNPHIRSKVTTSKIMAAVMPKTKGRADGRVINEIAKELLSL